MLIFCWISAAEMKCVRVKKLKGSFFWNYYLFIYTPIQWSKHCNLTTYGGREGKRREGKNSITMRTFQWNEVMSPNCILFYLGFGRDRLDAFLCRVGTGFLGIALGDILYIYWSYLRHPFLISYIFIRWLITSYLLFWWRPGRTLAIWWILFPFPPSPFFNINPY